MPTVRVQAGANSFKDGERAAYSCPPQSPRLRPRLAVCSCASTISSASGKLESWTARLDQKRAPSSDAMLSLPGRKGLRAKTLATRLGCDVGETIPLIGWAEPAVIGAAGDVAVRLQAAGGRWSSREGAHLFPSWSSLEEVLQEIIQTQDAKRP